MSIVLIILGILLLVFGLVMPYITEKSIYVLLILFGLTGLLLVIPCTEFKNPTKQDVLNGEAIYQETQVITGNDTIKTYDIVWKQEN